MLKLQFEYHTRMVLVDHAWRPWSLSGRLERALFTLDWFMSGKKPYRLDRH